MNYYFINYTNEIIFNLLIKFFVYFGTELLSPIIRSIFQELGSVGLDIHLLQHAENGNWKKFKNCLKSLIK